MDPVRFGLSIRALRRRRGWTQAQLGERAGASQGAISHIERGEAPHYTWQMLERTAVALGCRLRVSVLSHGEDLDRLLDADHAAIVEWVIAYLSRHGWEVAAEVTFSVYGERGSIDVLAFHPPTGSLLLIEVKSVIPDVQATLAGIDRKARLAARIARERGWRARTVSRWLVVPGDRTTRRRIERHASTFAAVLPRRTAELKAWVAAPSGAVAGIFHVPEMHQTRTRHRIGASRGRNTDT